MKKTIFSLTILSIIGIALSSKKTISTTIKNQHIADLKLLLEKTNKFKSNITLQSFEELRNSYKLNEPLLTYFSPEINKLFINGAPLPRLDKMATKIEVLEPEGLQIIEEMLYDETVDTTILIHKINTLQNHLITLYKYHKTLTFYDRHIFEASRFEILRITCVGITGFDTPGSDNAIKESTIALKATYNLLSPYLQQNPNQTQKLKALFEKSINYISTNHHFDNFNRFEFIKQHMSPIYGAILKLQLDLGVETIYEVNNGDYAINYLTQKVFDSNFFNKSYFTQYINKYQNTKVENLGRTLFFDPVLSSNNKRACASCHDPQKAFTDGLSKSIAFDMQETVDRNSPTIINSVYAERFFHDMRVEKIENQFEHVIVSDKEFNTNYNEILSKLNSSEEYLYLFNDAFPEYKKITKYTFSTALAVYISSVSSFNSPFDKYINGEEKAPQNIINGFNLFMGKAACATCHFPPSFSGLVPPLYVENESEVLGVPSTTDTINAQIDDDLGRFVNGRPKEKAPFYKHSFKTPTLRNIELTSPYMHNGVYKTLEEVVDFYNKGGGEKLGFNVPNQTLPFDNLKLTEQEKKDLIAFMKSLNDTINITATPQHLPSFNDKELDKRIIGGEY